MSLRCRRLSPRERRAVAGQKKQHGQALIYGLFVLACGVAALFFLFNVGQLISEKTKLVNTADAVAYSAGVMQARALNYLAYTNRAIVANEVAIAQVVSLSSWARYVDDHGRNTATLNCSDPRFSYPTGKGFVKYSPLCSVLFQEYRGGLTAQQRDAMKVAGETLVRFAEIAKTALSAAQDFVQADLALGRPDVLQEVAGANYQDDGDIKVDAIPLRDEYALFDGKPFVSRYSGKDRKRLAQVVSDSAGRDEFVRSRHWRDNAILPSECLAMGRLNFDYVDRVGSTQLSGYDDWSASDHVALSEHHVRFSKFGVPRCRTSSRDIGNGKQRASEWGYSGLSSFYDLSDKALAYSPSNADPKKRDPKPKFVARITRAKDQTMTSEARSQVSKTTVLNAYEAKPAKDLYAAVSGSEVYFDRPRKRADGKTESASLFNPYWQVRLIDVKAEALAAWTLQGETP
ncbi:Putative Flp pilus-assembly TadE/G-like [Solimonas aquatica]|uniref:Putative Flp pilus-assembly TadE/G-like n=1 Tax=Solimonas aquatica TaxID=489703 RepID=A0A1H9K3S5_9GAMM|nr:pilus assembly protein TadG-related protein [Solimonas aquatica]SEQ93729.1 Putative Flp pilus-assembly TadE/G-like [Solimonas aquatica]